MKKMDAFYDPRTDTLHLDLFGKPYTLTHEDAWALLDLIELTLHGPSLVADHKGD
jgi:hypothetical protein